VATIVEQPRNIKEITIPKSIQYNGEIYNVTKIGWHAFYDCGSLTSVTIPTSITEIYAAAFYDCMCITIYCEAKSLPRGWYGTWNESICPVVWDCNNNEIADDGCLYATIDGIRYALKDGEATVAGQVRNVTSVNIPASVIYKGELYNVTGIGKYAFYNCDILTSVTIPDSVTSMGEYTFHGCSSLKGIEIPNGVTSIGECAFHGCSSLKDIEIPNGVTSIGDYAFWYCNSLTSITIPNSVTKIVSSVFNGCTSLVYNQYNNGYYLGNEENPYLVLVETKNKNMTNFEINEKTRIICASAFLRCKSLTSITIPDSVTSIGEWAFSGCTSLTSITIPDSVTSIGEWAFYDCTSLTIYCEATSKPSGWNSSWNYSYCPVVWGVDPQAY